MRVHVGRSASSRDPLVARFGGRTAAAREGTASLYASLQESLAGRHRETVAAFARWRERIDRAYGLPLDDAADVGRCLAETYALPAASVRPAELLFAVQTYFALVVRLVVQHEEERASVGVERPAGVVLEDSPAVYAWPAEVAPAAVERLADAISRGGVDPAIETAASYDRFKALFESVFPRRVRHGLGEYYTPDWLAERILDEVGYDGSTDRRLLDPACGSGTFLLAAMRRLLAKCEPDATEPPQAVMGNIVGFDLNPLAVLTARANLFLAVRRAFPRWNPTSWPVFLRDSILDAAPVLPAASPTSSSAVAEDAAAASTPFDVVVGNPPWVAWDHLPGDYREATKPLWRDYGLFSLSGKDSRHGGGKKDLAMLMLYVAADRYLRDGGRLGMVVTQTLFQTKGAGDGFRRFRLGEAGPSLGVVRVHDLVAVRPFAPAANWTAAVVLTKGRPTEYPVPYTRWEMLPAAVRATIAAEAGDPTSRFTQTTLEARPIDPARPTSPWIVGPPADGNRPAARIGPSDYEAHLGANTGGANGVFWVEIVDPPSDPTPDVLRIRNVSGRAKRRVAEVEQLVESEMLHPLLRWGDVARYRAVPRIHLLLAQDAVSRRGREESVMRERYPLASAYLEQFREMLVTRAAYRRYQAAGPFYSMYDVGPYTLSPIKVVWRRMDVRLNAAVVEHYVDPHLGPRAVVPQETCAMAAVETSDEAHYLCAMLNSAAVHEVAVGHGVRGGKGFGTPSMLEFLGIRRFDAGDPRHQSLVEAGRRAHEAARRGLDLTAIQSHLDALVDRIRAE